MWLLEEDPHFARIHDCSFLHMEEKPEIPEFYRGRTVLLTGCTGFIGKVLIWKLLYSCPLIKNIYILLRKKHGKDVSERKDELFSCPVSVFVLPAYLYI